FQPTTSEGDDTTMSRHRVRGIFCLLAASIYLVFGGASAYADDHTPMIVDVVVNNVGATATTLTIDGSHLFGGPDDSPTVAPIIGMPSGVCTVLTSPAPSAASIMVVCPTPPAPGSYLLALSPTKKNGTSETA